MIRIDGVRGQTLLPVVPPPPFQQKDKQGSACSRSTAPTNPLPSIHSSNKESGFLGILEDSWMILIRLPPSYDFICRVGRGEAGEDQ